MNDVQALFLLIYSVTYVTALANWPPDTFATAAFFAKAEWDPTSNPPQWRHSGRRPTKSQSRFLIGSLFGSVLPLTYLAVVVILLDGSHVLISSNVFATILRVVAIGFVAIAPHAFHRFFMSILFRFDSVLVDHTPRLDEYLNDRRGGSLTTVTNHLEGAFLQLGISLLALAVLVTTLAI